MPRKLRDGEVPRTPLQWREVSAVWRTRYVQGKTMEKGLDVVLALTKSRWKREVGRVVDPVNKQEIRVDFHLDRSSSAPSVPDSNVEAKSGAINKDRDVQQLEGYQALLRRGETVHLFTRTEKRQEMSKEAQTLLALMKAQFPRRSNTGR